MSQVDSVEARLTSTTVPSHTASTATPACQVRCTFDRATPTVVHVSSGGDTASADPRNPTDYHLIGGLSGLLVPTTISTAMLVLEYGYGSVSRRIVCDLKPGSYQLPPSTQVKASVIPFVQGEGDAWNDDVLVRLAIATGHTQQPARPILTGGLSLEAAGTRNIVTPAGTRWVDCWSDVELGATAPIVKLLGLNMSPLLQRDYTTGVFTPSWGPVETFGPGVTYTLVNSGSAAAYCWVRFFLEL